MDSVKAPLHSEAAYPATLNIFPEHAAKSSGCSKAKENVGQGVCLDFQCAW